MFQRDVRPELLRDRVALFESIGLDDVWVVEDLGFGGGIATAAAALAATERLTVGIGILPSMVRNPLFTAMELATLCRLHPGRVLPGIGHGMQDWMATIGARPPSPVTALREVLTCVRGLLSGETLAFHGQHVHLDGGQLQFPPEHPVQLLAGVRGPRSVRLAGAVCDGAILAEPLSPAYVRWARALIDTEAAQAGRDRPTLVAYTLFSAGHNAAEARRRILPMLASMPGGLAEPSVRGSLAVLDFGPALTDVIDSATSQRELAAGLQPEWVSELSVSGTPQDCANAIRRLGEAGADRVVLVPLLEEVEQQVTMLGREILPLLGAAGHPSLDPAGG